MQVIIERSPAAYATRWRVGVLAFHKSNILMIIFGGSWLAPRAPSFCVFLSRIAHQKVARGNALTFLMRLYFSRASSRDGWRAKKKTEPQTKHPPRLFFSHFLDLLLSPVSLLPLCTLMISTNEVVQLIINLFRSARSISTGFAGGGGLGSCNRMSIVMA